MAALTGFAHETYYLGIRTTRRFIRVPANVISIIFFPLIQLLVFSQPYKDIVQLPGFGEQTSYLAYLAPGQVAFSALMAVAWSGYGLLIEYRSGYLDKLRANPIARWSILAGEMVPPFFQAAMMAGVVLIVSLLLGAELVTGVGGFLLILALSGLFGVSFAGVSFVPALMPGWMQVVNDWNPVTYVIEAIRTLMVTGYDWGAIGTALLSMIILGGVLQAATLWAFHWLAD